ncbi:hypothetical protein DID88_008427 [Monilinia fructigena]|uniref:Signal recognition particle SRP19 subunit n=1 Tax=Monilinia fructigena TaxID=38457 RepID=A0A395J605_9HELO|nr:hypothetical protein DID88_008427 [Monilinia fructigena]
MTFDLIYSSIHYVYSLCPIIIIVCFATKVQSHYQHQHQPRPSSKMKEKLSRAWTKFVISLGPVFRALNRANCHFFASRKKLIFKLLSFCVWTPTTTPQFKTRVHTSSFIICDTKTSKMSHARIEEVDDSDNEYGASDPSEGDISDVASDFSDRDIIKKRTPAPSSTKHAPPPNAKSSHMNPANIPFSGSQITTGADGTQFRSTEDSSKYKDFQCRRVGIELAVKNPVAREIVAACCSRLRIETLFEPVKTHPKDWANPGRVKVNIRGGGNPAIKNKHHLYILIAKHLKDNPTTDKTAMQPQLAGIPPPDPSKPLPRPAVPKGWKMGEILPYYIVLLHYLAVVTNAGNGRNDGWTIKRCFFRTKEKGQKEEDQGLKSYVWPWQGCYLAQYWRLRYRSRFGLYI